jgi:DNA-3-methyladenine glycosylase
MKLDRSFYIRDTIIVAKELLGCIIVHKTLKGVTKGQIVEVEAYMGPEDKGAHSYRGRHTPTMDPLFKVGGFAYIFQLHGYNYCFNVVTQKENMPQAVLIRAIEPIDGIELMTRRRKIHISKGARNKFKNLTNGPSKLCQAMDITTSLNGIDLTGDELFITSGTFSDNKKILAAPRINIEYSGEYKDKMWRFYIEGNEFVTPGYKK